MQGGWGHVRRRGSGRGHLGTCAVCSQGPWAVRPAACALQVKAGLGVNVIGLVTVMVAINTWGLSLFDLNTFPAWAKVSNITDQA